MFRCTLEPEFSAGSSCMRARCNAIGYRSDATRHVHILRHNQNQLSNDTRAYLLPIFRYIHAIRSEGGGEGENLLARVRMSRGLCGS